MPSRRLLLVVMCVGYFLVLLDVTVVNVALPSVAADLGATVPGLQGVVVGYTVALAVLLLPSGLLGDRVGHRQVVLIGLAVLGVGSLGCGLAASTGALVVARVVQGGGAALLLPGTLAIVADTHPEPADRARAIAAWAAIGGVALPAGPLVGGLLVDAFGWRSVFLLNVPVVAAAAAVAARIAPRTSAAQDARRGGGKDGGLRSGLALFRSPAFSTANAVAGAMNLGTLGLLFLLTLFLQRIQGRSPAEAGLAVLPALVPLAVLPPFVGRWVARSGPAAAAATGLLIAASGTGLVATWQAGTSFAWLFPGLLLWGCGLGLLAPAVVTAAVSAAPPERSGLASGVNNTARQTGGALGIAAYGALAGSPARAGHFLTGLHAAGLATCALYAVAAMASLRWIRELRPTSAGSR